MAKINRRSFVKGAAIGAVAAPLATPALAQERIEMAIVATWGRDFPGLGTGARVMLRPSKKFQVVAFRSATSLPASVSELLIALMKSLQAMRRVTMLLIITGKVVIQVMVTSQPYLSD